MRSAELAKIAGVTVRTLRHYHQLGLLEEPLREANGYRIYSMEDLIRVLRIRNVSAAGVSLEETAAMLDAEGSADTLDALLADADQRLATDIARMWTQRELIAEARAAATTPDVPAGLLRFLNVFDSGSPRATGVVRDQLLLSAQLLLSMSGEEAASILDELSAPAVLKAMMEVNDRFTALTDDASQIERDTLTSDFVTFLASGPEHWRDDDTPAPNARTRTFIDVYKRDVLNKAQRAVLEAVSRRET